MSGAVWVAGVVRKVGAAASADGAAAAAAAAAGPGWCSTPCCKRTAKAGREYHLNLRMRLRLAL